MDFKGDDSFLDAITGNDRRVAIQALIRQVGSKLDAGMCDHCGGPRGEAAGFASLTLRLMKLYEALDALPTGEEVSARDEIAAKRASRRTAPASFVDAERRGVEFGPGGL